MDCRSFRGNHLAFLDGALDDAALVAMQCHLAECEACAEHDTAVRRSLLVFRNLPPIEPSADFQARLNKRLDAVRRAMQAAQAIPPHRGPGLGTFVATATGVMAAGFLLTAAFDWTAPPRDLALAPVIASRPAEVAEFATPPAPNPAIIASVSSGMAVWPAALIAEQAPVHFASSQFHLASWTR